MRTLAKKYGMSDVGLAKVCRKVMIPLRVLACLGVLKRKDE